LKPVIAAGVGGVLAVLAGLGTLAWASKPAREKKMSGQGQEKMVQQCVGRFCLEVPASMRRVGGSYEMSKTQIEEEVLGPPPAGAFERAWMAHLARIEAMKANRADPGDLDGEILEKQPLTPSLASVLYYESVTRRIVTLGALLDAGPMALWTKVDGNPERAELLKTRTKTIAAAYQRPARDQPWPAPGKDWFYLDHGAIAIASKYEENAEAEFEGHQLKVKVELTTKTTSEPPPGLLERFMQGAAALASDSAISLARKGKRKVAGLNGEEILLRDSDQGKLSFIWSFPGEPDSARHPSISLKMDTTEGELDQKTALWESMLDSMRPVAP
jgi:hypothetical protein